MSVSVHADAVILARDSYTGDILAPSGLKCALDGRPCGPVLKKEGYLVLADLSPGPHRLTLSRRGYADEQVKFKAGDGTAELNVTMKPSYPFPPGATTLRVTVTGNGRAVVGKRLWLALAAEPEIKLAQSSAAPGDTRARLYTKRPGAVTAPATYLIEDGPDSELVTLRELDGETGDFAAPLEKAHLRGRRLLPAQSYRTGPDGVFTAVLRAPCEVLIFDDRQKLLATGALMDGENRMAVTVT